MASKVSGESRSNSGCLAKLLPMKVVHSDDITTNAVPADQRIQDVQLMLCQLKPHTAIAFLMSLTPRSAEPMRLDFCAIEFREFSFSRTHEDFHW